MRCPLSPPRAESAERPPLGGGFGRTLMRSGDYFYRKRQKLRILSEKDKIEEFRRISKNSNVGQFHVKALRGRERRGRGRVLLHRRSERGLLARHRLLLVAFALLPAAFWLPLFIGASGCVANCGGGGDGAGAFLSLNASL